MEELEIELIEEKKEIELDDLIKEEGVYGDKNELVTSILDRSIVELTSDEIIDLGNYALNECFNLTTINLINLKNIGSYCFRQCSSLTTLNMPDGVYINSFAFIYCTSLKKIELRGVGRMTPTCFGYCSGLEEVHLYDTTMLDTYVFRECSNLKLVDLHVAISINANCFLNNTSLEKLIIRSNQVCALLNTSAFSGSAIANGTGFIYVPDSLVEEYKKALNWKAYASQIKGMSELI